MAYQVLPTTAESIINVVDAVILNHDGCDSSFVSSFVDITQTSAVNALEMAVQLTLISKDDITKHYHPSHPFAKYLVTNKEKDRATIFRLFLENYPPYILFKHRLTITDSAPIAADQVRIYYNLPNHRDEIKDTLTSMGTYSQSLITEGAGLYKATEFYPNGNSLMDKIYKILEERELVTLEVVKLLGDKAYNWIDRDATFNHLVTAYLTAMNSQNDPRTPILYCGNAYESFLVKFGNHYNINLSSATGINSKIDNLARSGNLKGKHKFIGKYLGHIRNACEHGTDPDIGREWNVSDFTSKEYVLVCITSIKNIVESIDGNYIV